jgi:hypothetical protein
MAMMNEEKSYEQLNKEARQHLTALACNMQFLLKPGDVAAAFLGAGLGVLLSLGEDVAREWLKTALTALDDGPEKLH